MTGKEMELFEKAKKMGEMVKTEDLQQFMTFEQKEDIKALKQRQRKNSLADQTWGPFYSAY